MGQTGLNDPMSRIGASVAQTHHSGLLERVEAGEELVIARHGRPVARLVPVADARDQRAPIDVTPWRELRSGATLEDIDWRELRDAGRR
jgi:prevent-host-death family protein